MTTIVWDGETLASDGLSTIGDTVADKNFKKIRSLKGVYNRERIMAFGVSGWIDAIDAIEKWIINGADQKEFITGFEGSILLITDKSSYYCCSDMPHFSKFSGYRAIGSGVNFAMSALDFGCNAFEAVKHACKFDVYSGGKIRKMKLRWV